MFQKFPHPVTVLIGLGFPFKVAYLRDALSFLDEYPTRLRDEAYEATISACRKVYSGRVSIEEANDIFTAFARRRDILVEDLMVPEAVASTPSVDKPV